MASRHHNKSLKKKKCSHGRRVIYILRKYYLKKKVAHFYRPVISARCNASCAGVASVTEVQEPAML